MNKYRVTITVSGRIVPADFNFVSAQIIVWANNADDAQTYAEGFLDVYGIGVYGDVTEVTELTKENQS